MLPNSGNLTRAVEHPVNQCGRAVDPLEKTWVLSQTGRRLRAASRLDLPRRRTARSPQFRHPAVCRSMQAQFEFSNSLRETSRSMIDSQQPTSRFVVVRDPAPADDALKDAVLAIGNFDGVHRGHRALIGAAR